MNPARRHAKGRKPEKRLWSQCDRHRLVKRNEVTSEAWDSVPVWHKYPKRLMDSVNKGPCMTLTLRANAWQRNFVGPPKLERKHNGYPLTNWKCKRLDNSYSIRWFRRKLEQSKRVSLTDSLRMWLPQSATV